MSNVERAIQSFPVSSISRQRISELLNDYLDRHDDAWDRFSPISDALTDDLCFAFGAQMGRGLDLIERLKVGTSKDDCRFFLENQCCFSLLTKLGWRFSSLETCE